MPKHTPGPWFSFHCKKAGPIAEIFDSELIPDGDSFRVPAGTNHLAVVCNVGDFPTTLANARLMAAAPELEIALEQFVWAFNQGKEHGGSVQWEDIEDAYGMACSALRKAKGGTP